ncbi:hypothetical protein JW905_17020 [bacterium]|nr:hypothetical protein [candidate division CSSED10-310 bacterium]
MRESMYFDPDFFDRQPFYPYDLYRQRIIVGFLVEFLERAGVPTEKPHRAPSGISMKAATKWLTERMTQKAVRNALYDGMTALEMAALRETVHDPQFRLPVDKFFRMHGEFPRLDMEKNGSGHIVPLLRFFVDGWCRMQPKAATNLRNEVPLPEEYRVPYLDRLAPAVQLAGETEKTPVSIVETAEAALNEVKAMLRLVRAGGFRILATGRPSKSTFAAVQRLLAHGDFYPTGMAPVNPRDPTIGDPGIKPFAWPLLLEAGGLVEKRKGRLALTGRGRKACDEEACDVLRELWAKWLTWKEFNELQRVEMIKGQGRKGVRLQPPDIARGIVNQALAELLPEKWLDLPAFLSLIIVRGNTFSCCRRQWQLYISNQQNWSLDPRAVPWDFLEGTLIRVTLLEYAAVLGMIDVALVPPWGVRHEVVGNTIMTGLSALSRYDGLLGFRVNQLGAYILGQHQCYERRTGRRTALRIEDDGMVRRAGDSLIASDEALLDTIADRLGTSAWRLDREHLWTAVKSGLEVQYIRQFLSELVEGDLPPAVVKLLDQQEAKADKFRDRGEMRLVECADESLAKDVVTAAEFARLCLFSHGRFLVIPESEMETFRKRLNKAGYMLR